MGLTHADEASGARRQYRPLIELGRGGMAKVYLAESLASGVRKLVVLKILNRDLANEAEIRAAFQREAELSARMNHPNVVQVFEVVEFDGVPVIVMEHLDGVALSRLLQHTRLPLRLHLFVLIQVLAGLSHFHQLRDFEGKELEAVHRDVSPQNVLVLHEGPVKVVDFGIAKIKLAPDQQTRTGLIKGKIHYMPPEQLLGESNVDRRADVFAVGVMLWEAVAGRRMWEGVPEATIMRRLVSGDLPKLRDVVSSVPVELERIVERAISFDRNQRYESAEAMQLELEHVLHELEGNVRPRELTEFMQFHFGDRRQFQQRAIERALRDPATSMSGVMECVTPPPVEVVYGSQSVIQYRDDDALPSSRQRRATLAAPAPVAAPPRRSRLLVPFIGVALLAAAVAGVTIARNSMNSRTAPAAVAAGESLPGELGKAQAQLRVTAQPADAEIYLDGVKLGIGRVERSLPVREDGAKLEVRLAGYVTEQRTLRLRGDTSVDVQLNAEAESRAAEPASKSSSSAEAEGKPSRLGAGARTWPSARAPKPAAAEKAQPAAAAPAAAPPAAAAKEGCNPPYRLGADGVKTYKAECF